MSWVPPPPFPPPPPSSFFPSFLLFLLVLSLFLQALLCKSKCLACKNAFWGAERNDAYFGSGPCLRRTFSVSWRCIRQPFFLVLNSEKPCTLLILQPRKQSALRKSTLLPFRSTGSLMLRIKTYFMASHITDVALQSLEFYSPQGNAVLCIEGHLWKLP